MGILKKLDEKTFDKYYLTQFTNMYTGSYYSYYLLNMCFDDIKIVNNEIFLIKDSYKVTISGRNEINNEIIKCQVSNKCNNTDKRTVYDINHIIGNKILNIEYINLTTYNGGMICKISTLDFDIFFEFTNCSSIIMKHENYIHSELSDMLEKEKLPFFSKGPRYCIPLGDESNILKKEYNILEMDDDYFLTDYPDVGN